MKKESGYYRSRKGSGFTYTNERGRTIISKPIRTWIESLAIPPAWTEVWISKDRAAYMLATGRDQKNRKQYIYHPDWTTLREEKKFLRLLALGQSLQKIRRRLHKKLQQKALSKDRVLAAVVSMIDQTGARVGSEAYTKENGSYGVTTVRKKHVSGARTKLFSYIGKSGQERELVVDDPLVVQVIRDCEDTAGFEVFKYFNEDGVKQVVTSDEVNEFIRKISGVAVTAKDFRTWYGTSEALKKCITLGTCGVDKKAVQSKLIFKHAASALGNTPKIAEASYVHPLVVELYFANKLPKLSLQASKYLEVEEATLIKILEAHMET